MTEPVGDTFHGVPVPNLQPKPQSIATVAEMRHSEVEEIHVRLGRLCKAKRRGWFLARAWAMVEWDRFFGGAAVLFLGGALGGAIGLIPFLSTDPPPSDRSMWEYGLALATAVFVALLCLIARMAIKSEREDSVLAIYDHVGKILGRYNPEALVTPDTRANSDLKEVK